MQVKKIQEEQASKFIIRRIVETKNMGIINDIDDHTRVLHGRLKNQKTIEHHPLGMRPTKLLFLCKCLFKLTNTFVERKLHLDHFELALKSED